MNPHMLRRSLPGLAAVLIAGAALTVVSVTGTSHVTRPRLERNLSQTFSNLYVQQAKILGHAGITAGSLHARAQCDKGGPHVPDHGAGADWICYMSWTDKNVPLPDGSGKFELNVHSSNCYTAGGPSKLIGLLTITNTRGKDVQNPLHEFDGCFDPAGSNAPTGVTVPRPPVVNPGTPVPSASAALTLPHGSLVPDGQGRIAPRLTCSSGPAGCAGTVTATLDRRPLGTSTYALAPGAGRRVHFRLPASRRGASGTVVLTAKPLLGTVVHNATSLTVSKR